MKKVLILGISGSGKTTLAKRIVEELMLTHRRETRWFNSDKMRDLFDDWDFSHEGRLRQAHRMGDHADSAMLNGRIAIVDFICPTEEFRQAFHKAHLSDIIVWMDRTQTSQYKDTDALFEPPSYYDYRITDDDTESWVSKLVQEILTGPDTYVI